MRHRLKIQIDRLVGIPIVFLLNVPARLLGAILRRDHAIQPGAARTIVVSKFVGMGSILQATPLLRALKQAFPEARLVFLTQEANAPLIRRLECVDEALYVSDRNAFVLAWTTLRATGSLIRRRVDLYFDLEVYSSYAAILSVLSLARNRLGFYRYSTSFKRGIYSHLMYMNTRQPIRQIYLQLGRMAGVSAVGSDELGPLRVEEADRLRLHATLSARGDWDPERPYVAVNPNASDLMLERRWPAEHFAQTIEELSRMGLTVVLLGLPSEAAYVGQLMGMVSPEARKRVVNSAGQLDLFELFALLEGASCVVTNDTGPMHMAIALRSPTVCLFGPGHPAHYGVERANVEIIYQPVFCSPCLYEIADPPCDGNNICMKAIRPTTVVAAVQRLIQTGASAGAEPQPDGGTIYMDSTARPLGMVTRGSAPDAMGEPCEACSGERFVLIYSKHGHRFWRCKSCGLQRIHPQPSDATLASIYGQHYYDAWGMDRDEEAVREIKLTSFRGLLRAVPRLPEGAAALDCGAATGFLMEVAEEMGLRPCGIELSEFGAAQIRKRFGDERVYQGPFEEAHFEALGEEPFDVAFMFDFIEHVRDPGAVLHKAHGLLKSGGRLLICTPNAASPSSRLMRSYWPHVKVEHLFYFSASNLRLMLERAGFSVDSVRPARKALSLQYLSDQFETYPLPLVTPAFRAVPALPARLRQMPFRVAFGEMLIDCRKR
jgi:ADP-heptose:LPS heptosyltransferase/2-polyprenyl-3-methyl-5-hydroxy-6-metoxy-1,4-benzoquinol methylase